MQQGLNVSPQMLMEMASNIEGEATLYGTNLNDMYAKFNSLSNFWSGPDYDKANLIMEQNKMSLLELGTVLHNIASALNGAASDYEARINRSAAQYDVIN